MNNFDLFPTDPAQLAAPRAEEIAFAENSFEVTDTERQRLAELEVAAAELVILVPNISWSRIVA